MSSKTFVHGWSRRIRLHSTILCLIGATLSLPSIGSAQPARSTIGGYEVSGPYHYRNLSVFLIHGKDRLEGRNIVTLEEALERGIVKVYETGTVNQLEIENLSKDVEVYIQAGDIVKGGRQDRTLGIDLTLAPNSGRVPIASFCVERGRWTQRGDEPSVEFTSSKAVVTSNELRLAIRESKNQGEVWANVDAMQSKLSENIGAPVNVVGTSGRMNSGIITADDVVNVDVTTEEILNETILSEDVVYGQVMTVDIPDLAVTNPRLSDNAVTNSRLPDDAVTTDRILEGEIMNPDVATDAVDTRVLLDEEIAPDAVRFQYQSARITPMERIAVASGARGGEEVTTSLQLTLENSALIDEVEEYMAALQEIVRGHDDVIGFAFTINGTMRNADVYASGNLFEKLWPKLLRAAATEAVSERTDAANDLPGSIDAVRNCFTDAEASNAEQEEIGERMIMVTRRSEDNVLFETQEKGEDAWLHRNYMNLEFK